MQRCCWVASCSRWQKACPLSLSSSGRLNDSGHLSVMESEILWHPERSEWAYINLRASIIPNNQIWFNRLCKHKITKKPANVLATYKRKRHTILTYKGNQACRHQNHQWQLGVQNVYMTGILYWLDVRTN